MSLLRKATLGLVVLLLSASPVLAKSMRTAHEPGLWDGSSVLSLQLTTGVADLATPEALNPGSITAYDHSEWGGQVQFQHLVSNNWGVAFAFGLGTFHETDKPGTNAAPGTPEFKYSQSSWNLRFGLDRYAHISPGLHLFVGPGIQYWRGHGKFRTGTTSIESQDAKRFALDGRMGAHLRLGDSVGLEGYLGHYWGFANATDTGAEVHWQPSGYESAMGLAFQF